MTDHHWIGSPDPDNMYGFLYRITNTTNNRQYIGRKFYHSYKKGKKNKESNWKNYTGSSKYLNEDIKELGKENFRFEILMEFKTRGGLVAAEVELQWYEQVLTKKLDDGTPAYYNRSIGAVKFIPKESMSEEQRLKISSKLKGNQNAKGIIRSDEFKEKLREAHTGKVLSSSTKDKLREHNFDGPYSIYLSNGHVKYAHKSLKEWADEYGYNYLCLLRVKNGKAKSTSHKSKDKSLKVIRVVPMQLEMEF